MNLPNEIVEYGISLTDGFFDLEGLSLYSAYSVPCLRKYLKQGLPYYKPGGGKVVVKKSEFDSWIRRFRVSEHKLNEYVDQVLEDLKSD